MTQRVITLLAVPLTILPASVCTVTAQAVAISRIGISCEEEAVPGRPTLKRRVVNAEKTAAENVNAANATTEKCKPESSENLAA